jgi:PAS domain S-box-containing protein
LPGSGLTALKSGLEYALLGADIGIALLLVARAGQANRERNFELATACLLMGMGEVMFAHYRAPSDFLNMAGHVYKVAAYLVLYRFIYLNALWAPYAGLARAQQELRASEDFARRVIEMAPDPIILVDYRGRMLSVNRRAVETFGYAAEEMIGCQIEMLVPPRLREAHSRLRAGYMANPTPRPMAEGGSRREVTALRRNGTEFAIEVAFAPVAGPEHPHVVAVMRDISVRRAAEAALTRVNAELEERVGQRTGELQAANRELEAFSYTVAHDLRAPLRSIQGFASILGEDRGLNADNRHLLERITGAAQSMAAQIDGLLSLARLARTRLHLSTVDLSGLARGVIAELRQLEPGRQVEVSIQEGVHAEGDAALLLGLLRNLLGNAWKYTARVAHARIGFGRLGEGPQAEYYVSDNGAGFEMAHAGHLFEVFQRLHSQEEFPGIGIGLASVRRIVERHGGSIRAQASPGQGATFYFTLDARPDGGGALQSDRTAPGQRAAAQTRETGP